MAKICQNSRISWCNLRLGLRDACTLACSKMGDTWSQLLPMAWHRSIKQHWLVWCLCDFHTWRPMDHSHWALVVEHSDSSWRTTLPKISSAGPAKSGCLFNSWFNLEVRNQLWSFYSERVREKSLSAPRIAASISTSGPASDIKYG